MSTVTLPEPRVLLASSRKRPRVFQLLLLVLAVLLLWGSFSYRRDLADARRAAISGSQIDDRCGTIEYATEGTGHPVLVLHGTGGGWNQGIGATRHLVPYGFQIIAPSRFGYLRTPMRADASPQAEADTWDCFLDALGLQRVPVIAMSAGAAPALQLALRHPDRVSALVLLVPAARGIAPITAKGPSVFMMKVVLRFNFPFWAATKLAPQSMLKLVAVPAALVPTLEPEDRAYLDEAIGTILPVSERRFGMANDARNQSSGDAFPIQDIRASTLLISAADDLYKTLPNARHAAAVMPNAQVMAFPSGGHLLLGHGHEIWPVVADFVRR